MKRQEPLSLKILLPLRHCFCVGACARVKDVAGEIPREARRCRKVTLILVDFLPSRSSGSEAQKHKFYLHIERASASQVEIYGSQQERSFVHFPLEIQLLSGRMLPLT